MNRKGFPVATAVVAFLLLAIASLPALAQSALEIPSGTTIRVRMIDRLSSEQNQTGDTFHGTLDEPIQVNGRELYPKGADVIGRVTDVHPTGRLSEPGELDLVLNTVSSGTVAASIHVQPLVIKGESHSKSNVTKIGGGAALGAVIGAIAGGGKGAAIGTLAGGAAGTGAAAATGKKPALVDSEAVLTFVTSTGSSPTTPPPSPTRMTRHRNLLLRPQIPARRLPAPHPQTGPSPIPVPARTTTHRSLPCAIEESSGAVSTNMPRTFRPPQFSVPSCHPAQSARFTAAEPCPPTSRTRLRLCPWPARINSLSCRAIWSVSSTTVVSC